jgi:formylglycine-generating enzyme required for sulfatase activity
MVFGASNYSQELFVSYAETDSAWVKGFLLPSLRLQTSQVVTLEDFQPGEPLANEFEKAIEHSRFILLVLSPEYMTSQWALFGETLATYVSIEENVARLIPLILSPVDLPLRLRVRVWLDCTDQANWADEIARLRRLLEKPEPETEEIACPYPGMLPFSEANEALYYGREELVQSTVERFRVQKMLTIISPSGSGKTSFLNAGLIPQLSASKLFPKARWRVLLMRPGPQPLHRLAALFSQHLPENGSQILTELENDPSACLRYMKKLGASESDEDFWVLIVDQFEEAFAQCKQPVERQRFFECLRSSLATMPDHWRLILAIRADFYADCQESILWNDMDSSLLNLPPLSRAQLRRAIVEPARSVGVYLEPALVERLIDDAEDQKGALPLLQETLVLMWSRFLHRHLLTLADYEALGTNELTGLEVALGRWADSSLAELRQESQRTITRRIFLRLIEFGTNRNDTRRQQYLTDLYTLQDDKAAVQAVLEYLVEHRLVTMGHDNVTGLALVDLAHEKLIESWPQLRDWLEAYHAVESQRRSLVLASTTWQENGCDESFLFSGKRLRAVLLWAQQWTQELGARETEFLASSQERDRQIRRRQWILISSVSLISLFLMGTAGYFGTREIQRQRAGSPLIGIEGGPAMIGSDNPQQRDHNVTLLPYSIEQFEVTNHQYRVCVEYGPCSLPLKTGEYDNPAKSRFPVVWVTAKQAHTYCEWLGRRLPTAVEWERAVRGTEGRLWPWGDDFMPDVDVNLLMYLQPAVSVPETVTVDKEPIYHLIGNVSEWVVRVKAGCQKEECHLAWNGEDDMISYVGGAYDRYIERVTAITSASPTSPDPSIGFRCVADKGP